MDSNQNKKKKEFLYSWLGRKGLGTPRYEDSQEGASHCPIFKCTVRVCFKSLDFEGSGESKTKKDAQAQAAHDLIQHLVRQGYMKEEDIPEGILPSVPSNQLAADVASIDERERENTPNIKTKDFLYSWCGRNGLGRPNYEDSKEGPSHCPRFKCMVNIDNIPFIGLGESSRQKDAQAIAARNLLEKLVGAGRMKKEDIPESILQTDTGAIMARASDVREPHLETADDSDTQYAAFLNSVKRKITISFVRHVSPALHVILSISETDLTQADVQRIQDASRTNGDIYAAQTLLDCLLQKKDWYPRLLRLLRHIDLKLDLLAGEIQDIYEKERDRFFRHPEMMSTDETKFNEVATVSPYQPEHDELSIHPVQPEIAVSHETQVKEAATVTPLQPEHDELSIHPVQLEIDVSHETQVKEVAMVTPLQPEHDELSIHPVQPEIAASHESQVKEVATVTLLQREPDELSIHPVQPESTSSHETQVKEVMSSVEERIESILINDDAMPERNAAVNDNLSVDVCNPPQHPVEQSSAQASPPEHSVEEHSAQAIGTKFETPGKKGKLKPEDEEKIRINYEYLLDEIDAKDLTSGLYSRKVINFDEKDEIDSTRNRKERNEMLLKLILRAGPGDAYRQFLETLEGPYKHVADKLKHD